MAEASQVGGIAADRLRSFIERIERLEEEKKGISDDIKDVKNEAKGEGFNVPIMMQLIRLRKKDTEERLSEEQELDLYKLAIGME